MSELFPNFTSFQYERSPALKIEKMRYVLPLTEDISLLMLVFAIALYFSQKCG